MVRDIALDRREEAVAAADIDPEDDIDESQMDGLMEIVADPEIDSPSAQPITPTAVPAAAVPATMPANDEQQPIQAANTSCAASTAPNKRRRDGPRKNAPAAAATPTHK
ncbi:unnamed protein product [Phytophthora fragariaefolia]|uniref:Unnamed protein product n=1 Tax=Phytophthora fragariaefolia TaxID=1490495 RepID=A0A9W6WV25_9STRA|nr:unnamed protein product [Phytophthora fragariaefolia]